MGFCAVFNRRLRSKRVSHLVDSIFAQGALCSSSSSFKLCLVSQYLNKLGPSPGLFDISLLSAGANKNSPKMAVCSFSFLFFLLLNYLSSRTEGEEGGGSKAVIPASSLTTYKEVCVENTRQMQWFIQNDVYMHQEIKKKKNLHVYLIFTSTSDIEDSPQVWSNYNIMVKLLIFGTLGQYI